jgi:PTS system N-acetylglucosamine-specific IIC component
MMLGFLQKIGKALMTPIAVLPVAALLLRLGFGDIFGGEAAQVMKAAGEAVFGHLDLIFGIGIAYGLSKGQDGAAALSGAIGVLVAKAVYQTIDPDLKMGVFIGIIIGVLAGTLYNRYHAITLPEFLGFFGGKRFVPILTALGSLLIGVAAGYGWGYVQTGIDLFSHAITGLGEVGTLLYGTLNRLLIPLGLHHILNSVFWFQLGSYESMQAGRVVVAQGDLHRFFAGDPDAGVYMAGFYPVMMFGLPSLALALYLKTPKSQRNRAGAILGGVALTSCITGITEPLEFLFLFIAPVLFVAHALLTGLSLALAHALEIRHGFGFSAGLIDYLINFPLATKPLLLIPLGVAMGLLYFVTTLLVVRWFPVSILREAEEDTGPQPVSEKAEAIIAALGGAENIVETDACITRLRMRVIESRQLEESAFLRLGAKGIIKPDHKTIQIIMGIDSERIATAIRESLTQQREAD